MRSLRDGPLLGLAWAGFLTFLIIGPWLLPGFIFATDFAGPRIYRFPAAFASYAGIQTVTALLGLVIPADIVGKILISGLLVAAGLTAFLAVPVPGFVPRAAASVVYLFNPFVYDRLAYGQLNVIGGYAVLPWAASSLRSLLLEPKWQRAVVAAVALALVGILDLHLTFAAVLFSAALSVSHVVVNRRNSQYLRQLAWNGGFMVFLAFVASAYWVVPILLKTGPEAARIAQIGEGDLVAFSTTSDANLGVLLNVVGLYGFWAERTGRFISMKDFVPIWPLALAGLLAIAALGGIAAWRGLGITAFEGRRPWVLALVVTGVVAAVLDVGISDPHVAPIARFLGSVFPAYRGLRDANKWAALLALAYSQVIPLGVVTLAAWVRRQIAAGPGREGALGLLVALVLAVPLYYGNGLLYGLHGQIRPSAYPAGWYAADTVLAGDPHPGRTVFLPWHGYLGLSFINNADRIVACPASSFFSVPVLCSQDLEVPGVAPPDDQDQVALSRLVASGGGADWASQLAARNFKYILLAREADWRLYSYLTEQSGLALVADYATIVLYRNNLWHQSTQPVLGLKSTSATVALGDRVSRLARQDTSTTSRGLDPSLPSEVSV